MTFDEDAVSPADPDGSVRSDESSADLMSGSGPVRRRLLLTSAVVALTAIAGITGMHAAAAAVSEPAASKPAVDKPHPMASSYDLASEEALWRRQELLSDLNYWIEALPGIKTSGFSFTIVDPDAGSAILVWHGPPDAVQRQIVDEARRRRIPISIQQRNYSRDDLEQAAKQLISIDSGTGVFQNFKVGSVGTIDIDFDGVTVGGDYIHPPAEGIPAADAALAQALAAKTGVAIRIERGGIVPL
ncbi:hypothetical protein EV385_0554 [Krasilnikovia cinnamomea]|uniref:Uncharacterized protein n=1 Tax=Krasilnikovia cinnamomea TaxID=349313 RepID=A0A4Q7ZFQ8_9ACTN|nr:hypothetical protein [Krasilnikovia cinnamomea]RZU48829.1 hypothetical protein EV385_0554 [Krasilnikovia cinnamomea]